MSEISEIEIKSMTKEQNYMRGYENGKSDVLAKIRADVINLADGRRSMPVRNIIKIIDKFKEGGEGDK